MKLKKEQKDVEYLMSEASLTHLPDYYNRIAVLKYLRYIESVSRCKLSLFSMRHLFSRDRVTTTLCA